MAQGLFVKVRSKIALYLLLCRYYTNNLPDTIFYDCDVIAVYVVTPFLINYVFRVTTTAVFNRNNVNWTSD